MNETITKMITAGVFAIFATVLLACTAYIDPAMIVCGAFLSLALIACFKTIDIEVGGETLALTTVVVASLLFAPENSYFSIQSNETTNLMIVAALIFATQFMNFFKILESRDYLAHKIIEDAKQYQLTA